MNHERNTAFWDAPSVRQKWLQPFESSAVSVEGRGECVPFPLGRGAFCDFEGTELSPNLHKLSLRSASGGFPLLVPFGRHVGFGGVTTEAFM